MAQDDNATGQDLSQPYVVHAQNTAADAVIEQFMRRMQSRKAGEPSPAGGIGQAAKDAAVVGGTLERTRDGLPYIQLQPTVWERVGSAAADIGYGAMVESPSAIGAGVNDAVRNAVTGLQSLGDWLQTNIGGEIPVPLTGIEKLDTAIQRPLEALAKALPGKVKDPETVTGHVIREGARFLTGFVPALRAFGAKSVPAGIAAGAVTDFATMDPDGQGLSDLIQSVPALRNPVTQFLAGDPNDNEAVKRLKHAVEGAGFGALAEGLVRGIRAVATARKAVPEVDAQKTLYGEMKPSELLAGADDATPLVVRGRPNAADKLKAAAEATKTGVPDQVAAKGLAASADQHAERAGLARVLKESDAPASRGSAGDGPEIFVNFARVNNADDVNQVIRDMADAFKGETNAARRGVQSNEQTIKLADELGMTAEDLLARRKGQPFNAEESLAARRLLNTSAAKLLELARKAADPNASMADQFNFRRMLAVHQAIQSEVIAARTETARALQSWAIPAGQGNVETARSVQLMLDSMGGTQVSSEMAKRMAILADQGVPPAALANMVRKGWAATSTDMVKEAFVLGLLWSPKTHIVNMASNLVVAFQQVYERAVAAKVGDALGSAVNQRVADGEAIAMAYGMVSSLHDAFRLAWRALKTGEATSGTGSKIDLPREPAISTATIARERQMTAPERQAFAESPMGRGIDFIGEAIRVPGRFLGAEDEFFKTIGYRGEVHAQALRQATQEGRSGPDLWRRMAEIANDPPEHIRISAADAALYSTFQSKPGEWVQALMKMREAGSMNPTFLVLPFIKTPGAILRYGFERSPLAPLVGQWRDDIAAGGARRDLALARMATGTATIAVGMDLASSGMITGPGPAEASKKEALLRQGWQPFSVYYDGKYYAYNRLDPLGLALGAAATYSEMLKDKALSPEDYDEAQEIIAHMIGEFSRAVVDKTYFKGVTEFLSMLKGAEHGEGGVARFLDKTTGQVLPFTSASEQVRRAVDPTQREVNSPWDAIMSKIAGLSSKLPPARDLWGQERKPLEVYGRAYDLLSPMAVTADKASPIDAELGRLDIGVDRIKKKGTFDGVAVNFRDWPEVYDEYVRLAGNELQHPAWRMGLKDYLDAVVSGRHSMSSVYAIYSDGPEGGKASFIRNAVSEYRRLAQQEIMALRARFGDFVEMIEDAKKDQQELKMPMSVAPPRAPASGSRLPR